MDAPSFVSAPLALRRPGALADNRATCRGIRRAHVAPRAAYLNPGCVDVDFSIKFSAGNFGAVFLGQLEEDVAGGGGKRTDIVVKCPIKSELGRKLYDMEAYSNYKLGKRSSNLTYYPPFLGEVIIPSEWPLASGLSRLGLVWQRSGFGETLETYLTPQSISQLATLLTTTPAATPLRYNLCAAVLRQLAYIVEDIQSAGIVHRDIKPENLLIVPEAAGTGDSVLQLIDFGSSCDWNSLTKKGLGLATCDPIYAAPEKRLDIFRPAFRFDVYSIGLIALRVALPSLTNESDFKRFVNEVLVRSKFSLSRVCTLAESGRLQMNQALQSELIALNDDANSSMFSVLATMLTESPADRAEISDCLRSQFVQFG